jgi:hypothetical protein
MFNIEKAAKPITCTNLHSCYQMELEKEEKNLQTGQINPSRKFEGQRCGRFSRQRRILHCRLGNTRRKKPKRSSCVPSPSKSPAGVERARAHKLRLLALLIPLTTTKRRPDLGAG